jgi:SAM-dependent methyltransferase
VFTAQGPSVRELTVQALSSVEHGYDLLAPKFDHTPFRTSDAVLDAVSRALHPLGPFSSGLDLCCGTGAGMRVLRGLCRDRVTGLDISAGMLAVARDRSSAAQGAPRAQWVRADARALPFGPAFDLVVTFGALGHFLPRELAGLFAQVHSVLRPGGRFVFPVVAPARPGSLDYWSLIAFDTVMRVRNLLWHPPFVMYYRAVRPSRLRQDLLRAGFAVRMRALPELGRLPGGAPRCRMLVATR